ncbi:Dabb family protein [Sphingobacterium bovistauri]|uniref:Dabb family protein n=1 Tax=Sphingobacterium bovistauri TaxID=2781959 RepID=A0ABS7Z2F1_9SPHI|nr:Dabb family protein [Sphingobacterium bovistauri]MCA5004306.1 Dabb family protein [Sphingobacterium bovistauri]
MKRRIFLGAGIAGLSTSLLSSCTASTDSKEEKAEVKQNTLIAGNIIHQVYFWLKEGITPEEEKDFLEFFRILKTVPGIKSIDIGKPAPTNPRPVVDNSFSYSITVSYEGIDEINVYEVHPIHLDAVEKYKKYWTKVEVRDTVVIDV